MYIVQCMYMLQSVGFQSPKMIQPNAQCASTFDLEFRETETSTVSLKTLFTASYLWHSPISDASLFVTPTVLVSGAHLFLTPNSFWHLQYLFKTTTYRYFRHPTISDTYLVPIYGTHLFLTPVLYLFLMPTYFWHQYCSYFWWPPISETYCTYFWCPHISETFCSYFWCQPISETYAVPISDAHLFLRPVLYLFLMLITTLQNGQEMFSQPHWNTQEDMNTNIFFLFGLTWCLIYT